MLNTGPTLGSSQLKTSSWLQPLPARAGKPGELRPGRAKFQMCHSSLPLPHINPFLRQSPTKEQMKGLLPLTHTLALRWCCPHSGWVSPPWFTRKMLPSQSILDNSVRDSLLWLFRLVTLSITHLVISSWCREPRSATIGLLFCLGKL